LYQLDAPKKKEIMKSYSGDTIKMPKKNKNQPGNTLVVELLQYCISNNTFTNSKIFV